LRQPVVGIFHAGVRRDHRRRGQGGAQLGFIGERPPVGPLAGIGTVAHQTGAVGQQLGQGYLGHRRMEAVHMAPYGIVEAELAGFAQLEDGGGGKAFRMGSDAEPVTRRQPLALDHIGVTVGPLEDHPTLVRHSDDAARQPGLAHLVAEPFTGVAERVLQPLFQCHSLLAGLNMPIPAL